MARLVRRSELLKITGLSYTTIWRLENEGKFPRRRKIGSQTVAWLESDIDKWITSLKRQK